MIAFQVDDEMSNKIICKGIKQPQSKHKFEYKIKRYGV